MPAAARSLRLRSRCLSGRRGSLSAAGRTAPWPCRTGALRSPRDASPTRPRRGRAVHRADGFEVDAEQLPEAATVLQPAVRRALRCRVGQTPDDGAGRRRAQRALTPKRVSSAGRPIARSAHRPTCSTPTLRGRTRRSESTSTGCTSVGSAVVPPTGARAGDQLRGYPLRFVFDGGRVIGHQRCLARSGRRRCGCTTAAIVPGGCRSGARDLSRVRDGRHFRRARSGPGDERSRAVRPRSAGLGAPNEHAPTIAGACSLGQYTYIRLWHYIKHRHIAIL